MPFALNHRIATRTLSGDFQADLETVYAAIRSGRLFMAVDPLEMLGGSCFPHGRTAAMASWGCPESRREDALHHCPSGRCKPPKVVCERLSEWQENSWEARAFLPISSQPARRVPGGGCRQFAEFLGAGVRNGLDLFQPIHLFEAGQIVHLPPTAGPLSFSSFSTCTTSSAKTG